MLKFVAKYTPSYIFWTIVKGVVLGCINSFTGVIFIKMLFDAIGAQNAQFKDAASVIAIMAGFSLITYLFYVWYRNRYSPKIRQTLHLKMQEVLFDKARSLDLACYDDPKFYNDFVWATNESDGRASGIMDDIGNLIARIITTLTVIGVLLTIDIAIVIIILAVVGLSAAIDLWRKKVEFKLNNELVPEQRKADYITRVYSLPDYSKEIRLSHAGELMVDGYTETIERQKSIRKRFGFITYHISNLINMLNLLIFEAGISILLIYKLFSGDILLGDFAAGNNAVWQLHWQINTLVEFLVKFPEHSLYIEKFRAFMEYEPKVKSGKRKVDEIKSIEFKNVSFSYPSSETESLKNIDLTINKGEKIAIVGYNGAGKTTLIKLLLRLYDPTEGEVKLNGENLCEYETESYREKTGAVFQDYQIFAASIAENVAADIYNPENKEKVLKALHLSTFDGKLESLEKGIDTQLTREFSDEGVNLSGGEAQKIAISRVFYRDCELIVMDEPSSALDPMAEYDLNQTIMNYAQDKTVIFISHRLSTTRMADRIYMLADGSIIEQGTHEELMSACGKYSEMFNLQAEKYRKEQIINEIESLSARCSQEQS